MNKSTKITTTIAAALSVASSSSFGALILTNGGFETGAGAGTTSVAWIQDPTGWVQEETATIGGGQNGTAEVGQENVTALQATGARWARIVGDVGLDGGLNQDLGFADPATYMLTGDYFTGGTAGPEIDYAPIIEFYTGDPLGAGTLLATASLAGGALDGATNNSSTFSMSTGALAGGENIWVRLRTNPTAAGEVTRGGVDNLQLNFTPIPEPSTGLVAGLGVLLLALRRRR